MENSVEKLKLIPIKSKRYDADVIKLAKFGIETNLKWNNKTVKDFQKKLWELLEKKWYKKIKADWKIWWQTLEAIRLFLNKYKWEDIKEINDKRIKELLDATTDVYTEFDKLKDEKKKEQNIKDWFLKTRFGNLGNILDFDNLTNTI